MCSSVSLTTLQISVAVGIWQLTYYHIQAFLSYKYFQTTICYHRKTLRIKSILYFAIDWYRQENNLVQYTVEVSKIKISIGHYGRIWNEISRDGIKSVMTEEWYQIKADWEVIGLHPPMEASNNQLETG